MIRWQIIESSFNGWERLILTIDNPIAIQYLLANKIASSKGDAKKMLAGASKNNIGIELSGNGLDLTVTMVEGDPR